MNENFSVAAEYQHLPNGRYRGVVVKCLIGRFSTDGFEVHCFDERNTKDEAIRDAKNLAKKIQAKPNFII